MFCSVMRGKGYRLEFVQTEDFVFQFQVLLEPGEPLPVFKEEAGSCISAYTRWLSLIGAVCHHYLWFVNDWHRCWLRVLLFGLSAVSGVLTKLLATAVVMGGSPRSL